MKDQLVNKLKNSNRAKLKYCIGCHCVKLFLFKDVTITTFTFSTVTITTVPITTVPITTIAITVVTITTVTIPTVTVVDQLWVLRHHGRYQQVTLKVAPVGDPRVEESFTFLTTPL